MFNSLERKLVIWITLVSITTYATSAFCILFIKPWLFPNMNNWIYTCGVLLLGILWTAFLGWIASKMIIQPLIRLTKVINTVATGNLNVQIPEYKSQDEIGTLNHSFKTMLNNIRQMIADVSDSATVTDHGVDTLSGAIKEATTQIETISQTIDRMADAAVSQSDSAKELLDTAEESAETARNMDQQANVAIASSKSMLDTIKQSVEKLHSLVDGMLHISETSEKTLDSVHNLESQADQIGKISLLVGEMANQTQLLALNASIEAAHAGEHGKGFSVVAEQIGKLATDSATAVEQINTIVTEMQKLTVFVVEESNNQVDLIRKETTAGENARKALEKIDTSVQDTASALHQIVGHIRNQTKQIQNTYERAQHITDIAVSMSRDSKEISDAAQGQTAIMQEITASSELLQKEANGLREKTAIFKL